ncbi:hypothetical protein SUGI_0430810 [Cryptomeria japonica]|uniref:STS14 protein n=1 Tax=Cryptomeria japonica TaxID=3369 RepID=UPI002408F1BC|nr:STS14 protein [Cryptomeria japonica]GLJ22857.1 hypothetical protein SUGI_0430810 [Cryptomeria japonica]
MDMLRFSSYVFVLVLMGLCTISAQKNTSEKFLNAHNKERALVGVPLLGWNNKVAAQASLFARYQRDHDHCEMKHSGSTKYGENLFWGQGGPLTPTQGVQNWVDERKFYDYNNNSCQPDHQCGVYTQLVWKNSTELGCALVTCDNKDTTLIICYYSPPGNVIGEKPY